MPRETIRSYPMGINTSFFACNKRKFRFLFEIEGVTTYDNPLIAMPAQKASRPSVSFKEMDIPHLQETIYLPGRPDWKQLSVTLYDVNKNNPIWAWLSSYYNPNTSNNNDDAILRGAVTNTPGFFNFPSSFKRNAYLYTLDGCGNEIERWIYENAWPTDIDYQEMEMNDGEVLTISLNLRYDRAYNPGVSYAVIT